MTRSEGEGARPRRRRPARFPTGTSAISPTGRAGGRPVHPVPISERTTSHQLVAELRPSQRAVDAEPEDDLEGLDGLPLVDLREPRAAVLEQDRRLSHPAADLSAPEQDLFLEGIAA